MIKPWYILLVAVLTATAMGYLISVQVQNQNNTWKQFKAQHNCHLVEENRLRQANAYDCDDGVRHVVDSNVDKESK